MLVISRETKGLRLECTPMNILCSYEKISGIESLKKMKAACIVPFLWRSVGDLGQTTIDRKSASCNNDKDLYPNSYLASKKMFQFFYQRKHPLQSKKGARFFMGKKYENILIAFMNKKNGTRIFQNFSNQQVLKFKYICKDKINCLGCWVKERAAHGCLSNDDDVVFSQNVINVF